MEMVEPVPLKAIEEKAVGPTIKYTKGWSSELVEDQENVLLIPLELSTDRYSIHSLVQCNCTFITYYKHAFLRIFPHTNSFSVKYVSLFLE